MPPKQWGNRPGIRQKLGLAKAKVKGRPKASPLVDHLLGLYAKGKASASEIGDASIAASSSFSAPLADYANIAKAKKSAKAKPKHASRNSSRALHRALKTTKDIVLPPIYFADTPLWDTDQVQQVPQALAYLPIHEVLAALVQRSGPERWTSCAPAQHGFQQELYRWGDRQEVNTRKGQWAIVSLWGDSAPSTVHDSVFLLSFQVLSGDVKQRFWITTFNKSSVCKCGCQGRCTFDSVFSVVAWSVRALIAGVFPKTDHLGNAFPEGSYRGRKAGEKLGIHRGRRSGIIGIGRGSNRPSA